MIKNRVIHTCVALSLTLLLSACGWQLRGAITLPSAMSATWIDINDRHGNLGRALKDKVIANGGKVVSSKQEASATLSILSENWQRRTVAISNTSGKANEYSLEYTVRFALLDKSGSAILSPASATVTDSYSSTADALAKDREESSLKVEMAKAMAGKILRQMRFAN